MSLEYEQGGAVPFESIRVKVPPMTKSLDDGQSLSLMIPLAESPLSTTDLAAWETNYSTEATISPASTTVPEPVSMAMLAIVVVFVLQSRQCMTPGADDYRHSQGTMKSILPPRNSKVGVCSLSFCIWSL